MNELQELFEALSRKGGGGTERLSDEKLQEVAMSIAEVIKEVLDSVSRNGGGAVVSDFCMKYKLSDMLEKDVMRIASSDEPISKSDLVSLMYLAGNGDGTFDLSSCDSWDDDMVNKYAVHLKNYLYTYKPEATKIDPSINPEEEHVGPMAQDIEKVAPDCVKETVGGTKVVDGNRLALVNAGVIGDLSREVLDLRERLAALEAKK